MKYIQKWLCPKCLKCIKNNKNHKITTQHQSPTCIQAIYSVSLIITKRESNKKIHSKTLTWMVNPIEIHVQMATVLITGVFVHNCV